MTIPTPSGPPPQDRGEQLNAREAEIFRALSKIDPVLGGLFEELVRSRRELERPGRLVPFSHLMREVSNGVARHLSGLGFSPIHRDDSEEKEDCDKEEDHERHRDMLALALGKPKDHPAVTIWFRLHSEFRRSWHYWYPLPSVPKAGEAFDRFIDILWGLTGPFFDTVKDLEPLLAAESPTSAQVQGLHVLIARPAQRAQFFQRLQSPAWVEPLRAEGFFKQPADAKKADGRWSWDTWPEGDYLVRMAKDAPDAVARALLQVPKASTNPMVWLRVAQAARELPIDASALLAKLLAAPLTEGVFQAIFADAAGELAIHLARGSNVAAFPVARALLHVTQDPNSEQRRSYPRSSTGRVSIVGALSPYSLSRLLPRLIPAFEKLDVQQTLEWLSHVLAAALTIEFGINPDGEDKSVRWVANLAATDPREEDAREMLAVAIAGVAVRWAGRDPAAAAQVVVILRKQPWRVFRRIELYVLAHVGPSLQADLDRVVGDQSGLADDYPPPEYGLVLDRQFPNASPESQAKHIEAVHRGAGALDELRARLANIDGSPVTEEDAERYSVRWQQKRLRRFGEHLPDALTELRDALNKHPRVPPPTSDEVELEDGGGRARVVSWSGPGTPISATEIAARSPEELVEIFRNFRPAADRWDAPTPGGLARAVEEVVARDPAFGDALLQRLRSSLPDPTYVRAVLQGIGKAIDDGLAVPWTSLLPLIQWTAEQARGQDPPRSNYFDYADANWDEAKRAGARLIFRGAQKRVFHPADEQPAWQALGAFLQNPATWEGSPRDRDEPVENVDAALMLALNHLGGDVAQAFVELALWTYRLQGADFDPARLQAGLDRILAQSGRESYGARTMLGKYVPWLLLMDREGMLTRIHQLFAGGFAPPGVNAGWAGYITAQHFFAGVFEPLRRWYVAAAQALPEDRSGGTESDRTWSPSRHLLSHLAFAWLWGVATPDDVDRLIPTAFARAPVKDLSHLYWEIFRGWTDRKEAPQREEVDRLLSFWNWRLTVVGAEPDTPARTEELTALGWLALIPWLEDAQVLPLLGRTSELAGGRFTMEHSLWKRVDGLVARDPDAGFAIAAQMMGAVFKSDYPFVNADDLRPILKGALARGNGTTKQRARDLIHKLGETGVGQFGDLLVSQPPT
ncbi:MAG TPA: hypothetical protein VNJ06_04435 [Gemmatimonadales bacterium]|nr:hypothetical protein [Gemmatimonadales bacterium]